MKGSAERVIRRGNSPSSSGEGSPAVSIDFPDNVVAGMKIRSNGRSLQDPDGGREIVVQATQEGFRNPPFSGEITVENLSRR